MDNNNLLTPINGVSSNDQNQLDHSLPNEVNVSRVDTTEAKIILCYPVITGNGGKHVATMLAHKYKELYPNKRVALVDLDFHHPHFIERFVSETSRHGIDNLLDHIDGDNLPQQVFLENMITLKSGVDFLRGTKLGDKHIFICKNHIEKILKLLRASYDKVFLSTASALDNSGTIYGINGADEVILVTKNNYSNLKKLEGVYPEIMRFYFKDYPMKVVINQFNETTGFNLGSFISKTDLEGIGLIPFQEETCDGASLMKNKLFGVNIDGKRKKNERDFYKEILNQIVTLPTESR